LDKTIYFVTGYMRSFTSMMMSCLIAGGMSADYNVSRDKMLNGKNSDEFFSPNPDGYFELNRRDYAAFNFPNDHEGKLMKLLFPGLDNLSVCPAGMRFVFMLRNPEEIRQSYIGAFPDASLAMVKRVTRVCDNYIELVENSLARLRNRKDVISVTPIIGEDLIRDPLTHFRQLREIGWPIDARAAAKIPTTTKHRFKIEELTLGI